MLVSGFTAVGMSTRAIAATLGVSQGTVRNDQKDEASSEQNYSVDTPPIKGLNGKTYKPRPTKHHLVQMFHLPSRSKTPTKGNTKGPTP